jgi:hypothetical protein
MTILKFELTAAFTDAIGPAVKVIQRSLNRTLLDGCEAECLGPPKVTVKEIPVPDPDYESDAAIENWQERAQREMEAL